MPVGPVSNRRLVFCTKSQTFKRPLIDKREGVPHIEGLGLDLFTDMSLLLKMSLRNANRWVKAIGKLMEAEEMYRRA
jgi:hypothetical protein